MKTKIVTIGEWNNKALDDIDEAARILREGGLVAFPTETVYGLGADALNADAVAAIYGAKGRPSDNPLIVHVAKVSDCLALTPTLTSSFQILADRFWPGPLTMVVPKKPEVPELTTGGLPTVAIRMPEHPVALELIRRSGCPIAAPSANRSGRPSPTKGDHVVEDLDGRIHMILMSGDCQVGIESTVLDLTGEIPTILRPGILSAGELAEALGTEVAIDPGVLDQTVEKPKAPGMKYTHYAPKAKMVIYQGPKERVHLEMIRIKEEKEKEGQKVGLVAFENQEYREAARTFFAKLRELDLAGVDLILAEALDEQDSIGFAVMNRMLKSAGYRVVDLTKDEETDRRKEQ